MPPKKPTSAAPPASTGSRKSSRIAGDAAPESKDTKTETEKESSSTKKVNLPFVLLTLILTESLTMEEEHRATKVWACVEKGQSHTEIPDRRICCCR